MVSDLTHVKYFVSKLWYFSTVASRFWLCVPAILLFAQMSFTFRTFYSFFWIQGDMYRKKSVNTTNQDLNCITLFDVSCGLNEWHAFDTYKDALHKNVWLAHRSHWNRFVSSSGLIRRSLVEVYSPDYIGEYSPSACRKASQIFVAFM